MIKQYYVFEIQLAQNGEYAHYVYWIYDNNSTTARLKAESKYYEILSAAAVSNYQSHSATLLTAEGVPVLNHCYYHQVVEE